VLLLVYAGAVMVFFLFVVMFLNLNTEVLTTTKQSRFRLTGGVIGLTLLTDLVLVIRAAAETQVLEPSSIRGAA